MLALKRGGGMERGPAEASGYPRGRESRLMKASVTQRSSFGDLRPLKFSILPNNGSEKRDLRAIGVGVSRPTGSPPMIELSRYAFETLREDEEFAFCRGRRDDGELPTILLVAPVSEHPVPAILERLEHDYSLRNELHSDWAARPLVLAHREGRTMLILEDPGGEPLDRLLGQPMEVSRF